MQTSNNLAKRVRPPRTRREKDLQNLRSRRYRKKNLKKVRKSAREWGRRNAERVRKYSLDWYHRNPKKTKNSSLRKNHGITLEEYNRMFCRQSGECAICQKKMKIGCVDHDHASGLIRGLLCHPCNFALGLLKDSPVTARRAADYLERGGI